MNDALKNYGTKPNLKEINEKSTFSKRFRAKLKYNNVTKMVTRMKAPISGPTLINLGPFMTKAHNMTMWFSVAILGLGFYSSVMTTLTRKEVFAKNYALIEQKYGEKHREAFG